MVFSVFELKLPIALVSILVEYQDWTYNLDCGYSIIHNIKAKGQQRAKDSQFSQQKVLSANTMALFMLLYIRNDQ